MSGERISEVMSSLSNSSRGKRLGGSDFKSGKIRSKKRFEGGRESKEGGRVGGRGGRGRDSRERRGGGGPPKNPNPKSNN